jgi:hypothetical protein
MCLYLDLLHPYRQESSFPFKEKKMSQGDHQNVSWIGTGEGVSLCPVFTRDALWLFTLLLNTECPFGPMVNRIMLLQRCPHPWKGLCIGD